MTSRKPLLPPPLPIRSSLRRMMPLPRRRPQPLDEAEGEKAEESDVDRSFDEILKIFSRGDKF